MVLERIEEAGTKRRKDSIVLQGCLITALPEWIKRKSDEEQRNYFDRAYEFMEKEIRTFKNWNEDLRVENYGQSEEIKELNRNLWELNRRQSAERTSETC